MQVQWGLFDFLKEQNLDFISNLYQECLLDYVQLDFVVQQQNYKEIPIFIRLINGDRQGLCRRSRPRS